MYSLHNRSEAARTTVMNGSSFDAVAQDSNKAVHKHRSSDFDTDMHYTGTDERRQLADAEYGYTWARCVFPQLNEETQKIIGSGYEYVRSAYMGHSHGMHPDIAKATRSMRGSIFSEISEHGHEPRTIANRYCLNERCLGILNWADSRTLGSDNVAQILANEGHAIHECVAGIATGRTASLLASAIMTALRALAPRGLSDEAAYGVITTAIQCA